MFGVVVEASKAPAVTAKLPAMPSTELAPSWSFVPLRVTLNRLAVPDRVEVPMKLAVPAVAVNVPSTDRSDLIEKLEAVEIPPRIFKALKLIVPAPLMVLAGPVMVMVPPVAEKLPVTLKFPATVIELVVAIAPETVRWLKVKPGPLIVLDAPLIVTVPDPPERWVKVPEPLVARFPETERLIPVEAVTPAPVKVRLLKLFTPPLLITAPVPLKVTELVLPVKVPLLVQFPPME